MECKLQGLTDCKIQTFQTSRAFLLFSYPLSTLYSPTPNQVPIFQVLLILFSTVVFCCCEYLTAKRSGPASFLSCRVPLLLPSCPALPACLSPLFSPLPLSTVVIFSVASTLSPTLSPSSPALLFSSLLPLII